MDGYDGANDADSDAVDEAQSDDSEEGDTPSTEETKQVKEMFAVYGMTGNRGSLQQWQRAMGLDWVPQARPIAQGIPPTYTEFIGRQVLQHLGHTLNYPPISWEEDDWDE
eukprot:jgi/Chrzof1/11497/UNPLg00429.t1